MWPEKLTLTRKHIPESSEILVPGSKSYTNRALIIGAQTSGESILLNASLSTDSTALIDALRMLSVSVDVSGTTIKLRRPSGEFKPVKGEINVGPAGTTMRFLTALLASIPGSEVLLSGSARMHDRPIGDLVTALRNLGADIEYAGKPGCPPLRITGRSLKGGSTTISGSASSQFISALLLIAPRLRESLELEITGELVSKTYLDMTIQNMRSFGVPAEWEKNTIRVDSGALYAPTRYTIEGDASGASYLFGFAALSGQTVTLHNIPQDSLQGDAKFPRLLEQMGCTVRYGDGITITGTSELKAIECDMNLMPDTAQTLAVVAACASGTTRITGLSTLRHKETDRLLALKTELRKIGIDAEIGDSWIEVTGGSPKPAAIDTYEDHRMAMSFAMLSGRIENMVINDPKVVEKSFPEFFPILHQLGIESKE